MSHVGSPHVSGAPYMTLLQLAASVRAEIDAWSARIGEVLVVAEVSEIRRAPTGHWFARLVERRDEGIVAEMQAVIWVRAAGMLEAFARDTGTHLTSGMEVLLRGTVSCHERYGLRFIIQGIDPTYTMGEMQRKRREVVARLTTEGLLTHNKAIPMPCVPQRVAVVSSDGAAGYGDFVQHLSANPYGYVVAHTLFPATMQGDSAPRSIADAVARASSGLPRFDAVVIIRGGGSQVDLSCFDSYDVGAAIARCALPVITGIGHERDETVADMVAHTRAKTPTACAQFILTSVRTYEERIEERWGALSARARELSSTEAGRLATLVGQLSLLAAEASSRAQTRASRCVMRLAASTIGALHTRQARVGECANRLWVLGIGSLSAHGSAVGGSALRLGAAARAKVTEHVGKVEGMDQGLRLLDPDHVLRRGFSITRFGSRTLTTDDDLLLGDEIVTTLARGRILSRIYEVGGGGEEG
jgi:exodeoxyribonuclease VII large subunit